MTNLAIEKGSLILVTGATGSVGGAVASEILKAGYKVRAIVRNEEKAKHLTDAFHERYGEDAFHTVSMEDMTAPGILAEAMEGCSGVIHVASNTSMGFDPTDVITSSINLATAALEAASQTPTVVRFVFTSSSATLPDATEPIAIDSSSWAPDEIIEKAWSKPYGPQNMVYVYRASKILSERLCWDFVRERNPHFTLNVVVPMTQIGAFVHPQLVSSMNGVFLRVWKGEPRAMAICQSLGPTCLLNLGDSGLLHLAALTMDDVQGERILGLGEGFTCNDVVDALKRIDPDHLVPEKLASPPRIEATIDRTRTMELLARYGRTELVGLEESLRQTINSA